MEDSNDSGRFSPCSASNDSIAISSNSVFLGFDDESIIEHTNQYQPIVTKEMEEEEERIEEIVNSQEQAMEGEYEDPLVEREGRYKRLMHLLKRSRFYTNYLLKKLTVEPKEKEEKRKVKKEVLDPSRKDHPLDRSTDDDLDSQRTLRDSLSNRQNIESNKSETETSDNIKSLKPPKKKRKVQESFDIRDIITKETVENVQRSHIAEETKEMDNAAGNEHSNAIVKMEFNGEDTEVEEAPVKTKITVLGFEVAENQPLLLEGGVMRDYQLKGVEWLKVLYEHGVNGILADEMGLGKTIQVIAIICHLIERKIVGPYLVVAPLSTLSNWITEFERFAPKVPVVLFHGNAEQRSRLYPALKRATRVNDEFTSVLPVVVTSYEIPIKESETMGNITWQYVIVDEGHKIKNKNTRLSNVLTKFRSKNRLLLTGTPLQNNLTELWSLLNFLLPELFDDLSTFNTWFDLHELDNAEGAEKIIQQEREKKIVSTLHEILFPFLLRRTKDDIVLDFPPKKEVMVYCPMTKLQMEMYQVVVNYSINNILNETEEQLPEKRVPKKSYKFDDEMYTNPSPRKTSKEEEKEKKKEKKNEIFDLSKMPHCRELTKRLGEKLDDDRPGFVNRAHMQAPSIVLKHIVNHPYLVRMPVRYNEKGHKILHVTPDLLQVSGKLLVLDAMLAKLKKKGHKVLLFCTSTMMLDILEEYVVLANHTYVRLDGSSHLMNRKDDIHAFNTDPNIFVFLLSTRAGGLGINLTGADTVILYNSDWNPMIDMQAQDRAHRIGQTKPVVVYRFNVAGTIDEKIIECATNKRKLERVVMKTGAFKLSQQSLLDLQELSRLLKESVVQKKVHSNGFIFSDEELEELLDRSDLIETDSGNDCKQEVLHEKLIGSKSPAAKKKIYKVTKVEK